MLDSNSAAAKPVLSSTNLETAQPGDMADLLIAYLEQLGIDHIFGIPGGAIEPVYDAIARHQRNGGSIRHIVARHEAGAAFMADGYFRETGKIGVCIATSGPGATNLITAVATSYGNDIPMLVITGQPALPSFGKHTLQESACTGINVLGMFRHCSRYNSLVSHAKQLEQKLITALQRANRSPRGPVHLTVPVDVFRKPSTHTLPAYHLPSLLKPASLIDDDAVESLRVMLAQSDNVVMLVGGFCGESIDLILRFAAQKGATIVTTPDGKGLVSPQHPLFRGVFGFGGHASAEAALRDPTVDLILAIGTSMGEWNTGGWCDSVLNNRMVHIDESEEHLARTPMARAHLRGSTRAIFRRLIERSGDSDSSERQAQLEPANTNWQAATLYADAAAARSDATPIKPQRLMSDLGRLFPPATRFLADAGNSVAWAAHYLQPDDRRGGERRERRVRDVMEQRRYNGGWLRLTPHFAPMGWAIGAAIGTAVANRGVPVVCITGDGSMLMSGQEISVAVAENLCVIFVILNDSALGMVKHGQRLGGGEPIGFALPPTDFAMMARAMGAQGHTIHSPADMDALDINEICCRRGPTLLDVYIDPEEIPPMNARLRVLAEGS